jgi:hypothetical protein
LNYKTAEAEWMAEVFNKKTLIIDLPKLNIQLQLQDIYFGLSGSSFRIFIYIDHFRSLFGTGFCNTFRASLRRNPFIGVSLWFITSERSIVAA